MERVSIIGEAMFPGDERYAAELKERARALDAFKVEFCGFREDVSAALASLDVLVHCSIVPEPFGQVVVQGMAHRLPVVATAAGGPLEIIDDGVTGLLYPPGDTHELARILSWLAVSPESRERLAAAGMEAGAAYAVARIVPKIEELYRSLT
ncbi:hypothetical protein A6V29_05585 [Blastococcus sp. CCUG 61487]|nr:hypothetical protein A6V29_05585 [Blastococcus sp. CCUG 61487]